MIDGIPLTKKHILTSTAARRKRARRDTDSSSLTTVAQRANNGPLVVGVGSLGSCGGAAAVREHTQMEIR